ncbi:C1-like protein [Corchorus olitorius]|uniref:C1-like protein n=1 Tax=Corchorus olitorius TaxID=93759 RepID=A0A1R3JW18_9ROSI|nr:C1-like protein [Corchorus olitorius]
MGEKLPTKVNLMKIPSLRPSREKVVPPKIFKHLHELASLSKSKTEKLAAALLCKGCQQPLVSASDPNIYKCAEPECNEFIFHKSCAEVPGNLELVRKNCPEFLKAREPEYGFQKEQIQKCKICEEDHNRNRDAYECSDCLVQINIKGKFLPIVVIHESHTHPLNLIMVPISVNYEFGCCGCGELGKSISYRCFDCNFNLHVDCLLLPRTLSGVKNNKQSLRLTYGSLEENWWDKTHCKVCNKEISPEYWFYYSPATESVTHIGCVSAVDQ